MKGASVNDKQQTPASIPTPPIDYMSNGRATFAICKLCGCGLRGFRDAAITMGNAMEHLYANHEGWDRE